MHTEKQKQLVVEELEREQAQVALLTPSFADFIAVSWPNTSLGVIAQKDPVAEYLVRNFRVCHILNSGTQVYWYMVRTPGECPAGAQVSSDEKPSH